MIRRIRMFLFVMILFLISQGAWADLPELIPRNVLFSNPDKVDLQISPDGIFLAYLAPHNGVMNVWVRSIDKNDDRVVTQDKNRGIRGFQWGWDSRYIFYIQDVNSDNTWHIHATAFLDATGTTFDMTPLDGVSARFVATSGKVPTQFLIGLNKDNPGIYDIYRLDVVQGKLKLDTKNPGGIVDWVVNDKLEVVAGTAMSAQGGATIIVRESSGADWKPLITYPPDGNARIVSLSRSGKHVYVDHNLKTDFSCIYRINLKTRLEELVFAPSDADTAGVFLDLNTGKPLAASVNHLRTSWYVLDEKIRPDFDAIQSVSQGDFSVVSRDKNGLNWIVSVMFDDGPIRYYVYNRQTKQSRFLFTHQSALENLTLALMQPFVITARDGKDLLIYLTLPPGIEPKNLPMVLFVHGGPWARDKWGYNPYHQWMANRGYAVLSVNFRGSTGFGKAFLKAGNHEWTRKMQDDLADAVKWVIKGGYADKTKIAIMGGSWGGYSVLVGATTPSAIYCCGVDIVGFSNIMTLIKSVPSQWTPLINMFKRRVGDWETDPEYIKSISPLFKADNITIPLLIGQGKNDTRVKVEETLQIVDTMKKNGVDVVYIEFPDEGHDFIQPKNNMAFHAAIEKFLSKYLGGRFEPADSAEQELLDKVSKK